MAITKDTRYDRQLRLWGNHGQKALENAKICLINGSATGTELLKNLVLPGVGAVTIVDGNNVSERDCGNNFFVTQETIGQPRAQVVASLLHELNMEVKTVRSVCDGINVILDAEPDFLGQFTCVIVTQEVESTVLRVGNDLWARGIPLFVVRSIGMMGYMRVSLREHIVVDAHPDQPAIDLRLDTPFPALSNLARAMGDIDDLGIAAHKHVPYPIILLKHLERWKTEHDNAVPKTSKDKAAFKAQIRQAVLGDGGGGLEEEQNYDEAVTNARHAWTATASKRPQGLQTMFAHDSCNAVGHARDASSSPAIAREWFIVRAVRDFVEANPERLLPLLPTVPDLTASTENFLRLQNVYKTKADADLNDVVGRVDELVEKTFGHPAITITEDDIRLFCRHIYEVEVQLGTSLEAEYRNTEQHLNDRIREHSQNHEAEWKLYLSMRAVDAFQAANGRNPGLDDVVSDASLLKQEAQQLLDLYGIPTGTPDQFLRELCRWNGCELHAVAAVMGGMASQEVIKVLTQQFVPLDNTIIYNAMDSTSCSWKL